MCFTVVFMQEHKHNQPISCCLNCTAISQFVLLVCQRQSSASTAVSQLCHLPDLKFQCNSNPVLKTALFITIFQQSFSYLYNIITVRASALLLQEIMLRKATDSKSTPPASASQKCSFMVVVDHLNEC